MHLYSVYYTMNQKDLLPQTGEGGPFDYPGSFAAGLKEAASRPKQLSRFLTILCALAGMGVIPGGKISNTGPVGAIGKKSLKKLRAFCCFSYGAEIAADPVQGNDAI